MTPAELMRRVAAESDIWPGDVREALAIAWDEGHSAGYNEAVREMHTDRADESPNPFELDAAARRDRLAREVLDLSAQQAEEGLE